MLLIENKRTALSVGIGMLLHACLATSSLSQDAKSFTRIGEEYQQTILPLVKQFCLDCHSTEDKEGELDLEQFGSIQSLRGQPKIWIKVIENLNNGEMPPRDAQQPTGLQRQKVVAWAQTFLNAEALASAGDPGPVVLRRLSNAEYNYSVRDLTGVESLDPTAQFPVDGAAGEGFTNTGSAQSMSPSLVQKYLDAGKQVAAHAVLLPDGIEFSRHLTQRDRTDDFIARIQAFYRRFTSDGGGQGVNLQGIKFDTNQGGRLPVRRYIEALIAHRSGDDSLAEIAKAQALNLRYLADLDRKLRDCETQQSILGRISRQIQTAKPGDAEAITAQVAAWQNVLFEHNPVGHILAEGEQVSWLQRVVPIQTEQTFEFKLEPSTAQGVTVHLTAGDAGDGSDTDYVHWRNPRLVLQNGPDIPLRDVQTLDARISQLQHEVLSRLADYLDVIATLDPEANQLNDNQVNEIAQRHQLQASALKAWLEYLGFQPPGSTIASGHFVKTEIHGKYNFVQGWGTGETPSINSNSSDNEVRVPGIARPHHIQAHPSPTLFVAAGWESPITGTVTVNGSISDAHPECGDGQGWLVQHRRGRKTDTLHRGEIPTGGKNSMPERTLRVNKGDLISLLLTPRANYYCDLTELHLSIRHHEGEKRTWDLAADVANDILASNPHADRFGNPGVWHFYKGETAKIPATSSTISTIPAGSLLARWVSESDKVAKSKLALEVQNLMTRSAPKDSDSPNGKLYDQLSRLGLVPFNIGSLLKEIAVDRENGSRKREGPFGVHPSGDIIPATDLVVKAPSTLQFSIPQRLVEGRSFAVTGSTSVVQRNASVQLHAATAPSGLGQISPSTPFIANLDSQGSRRIESSIKDFCDLFPPTLCYARIVPVDEVVTMTLFYREDEQLCRLMLDDSQITELDRLWDELNFVAREPLQYQVAFEQIREFATQDRPDLVKKWAPLVDGVQARADAFRERLKLTRPQHVNAVLQLARRAWRRELASDEESALRELYRRLTDSEVSHEASIRLLIARVFTSPSFLYRREQPVPGVRQGPVSQDALATRLSYFLWSSVPDQTLRNAAIQGQLSSGQEIAARARAMMRDPRCRRLAEQFALQWLHIRGFDQAVEKNEKLYPEFLSLRKSMYHEALQFFEHLIRDDRSILEIIDADYTYVDAPLAQLYGLESVDQPQRIDTLGDSSRGGVLTMAAVLASQSGASRTSPILRGNWIYETLLGERLPKPPANVPQLPDREPQGLTARELIEKHSSDPACAKCHRKIDPFGFALESYDAIGRVRTEPVDTKTTLADGSQIDGIQGLRRYLLGQRRDDFVRQFCRKLLGYALGRELMLSDRVLVDKMMSELATNDYRFSSALTTIVTSKQFRQIRGTEYARR